MREEVQIIERNGKPEWGVLPYEEYLKLVGQAELLEDIRDFDEISAAIEHGKMDLQLSIHATARGKSSNIRDTGYQVLKKLGFFGSYRETP